MAEADAPSKRIFTYDEAAALLPQVRSVTEEAYGKVEALGAVVAGRGGAQLQGQLDEIIGEWMRAVTDLGVEVKGLWLVDFDNGSGYYCWRYPEPGLQYYHSYEDGFRGRMRLQ